MIRTAALFPDGMFRDNIRTDEFPALIGNSNVTLWVDLTPVGMEEREIERMLLDTFHFHPLAVDDALRETHVPRVDDWQDSLYVILHAVRFESTTRRIHTPELDVFLTRNVLVTYHVEDLHAVETVLAAVRRDPQRMIEGPDNLLYQLCDQVVSEYMPLAEQLDQWIDEVENEIFTKPSSEVLTRIMRQKRRLIRMRRSLSALREVLNKLARDTYSVIDPADRIYFRDVYDHTVRLYDIVESMRDLVGGTLDTYLSVSSNRINEVMKTLTITSVMFLPISFISSFFGMNFFANEFAIHPAISTHWIFWLCILLTVSIPPTMFVWMKFRRWI